MMPAEDFSGSKILIVDDLESNTILLEEILKEAGYANVTSTNGAIPVSDLHREHRYDLIVLDVQMPGQDGFAVMESLKDIEGGRSLPVLVMSGHPDHQKRAMNAGARDFLSKPFDMKEFLGKVRNLLELRSPHENSKGPESQNLAQAGDV